MLTFTGVFVASIHFQSPVLGRTDKGACPARPTGALVGGVSQKPRPSRPAAIEGVSVGLPWKGCAPLPPSVPPPPARSPAHAHARLHGPVAAGVRKRSVERRSYGAASTAAEEGSMSATRAKKVKMATKSCPECDQQVGRAGASERAGGAGRPLLGGGWRLAARGRAGVWEPGPGVARSGPPPARGPPPPRVALFALAGSAVRPLSCRPPPPGWQHNADKRTVMVLTFFCKFVDFRNTAIKPVLMGDF